jgi:hypothetical protein
MLSYCCHSSIAVKQFALYMQQQITLVSIKFSIAEFNYIWQYNFPRV